MLTAWVCISLVPIPMLWASLVYYVSVHVVDMPLQSFKHDHVGCTCCSTHGLFYGAWTMLLACTTALVHTCVHAGCHCTRPLTRLGKALTGLTNMLTGLTKVLTRLTAFRPKEC